MDSIQLVERPIFIVGPGRSGTTLLRSLLSAHSRIAITPETQFMNRARKHGHPGRAPEDFETFWSSYTSWVRFQDLGVAAERCRELIVQQGEYTFESIFKAVLTAYGERAGKERVGEKSPSHVHYLSEFMEWFPDARVLITERDPRAVVASQLKTPYVLERITPSSLTGGLVYGTRAYETSYYARDWQRIYGDVVPVWRTDPRVRVVSYEALVTDVETELRSLCDFLGEPFEVAMLTNRTSGTVPPPAGVTPSERLEQWRREHHATSLAPVSTDSLEKWKHDLSSLEISMIEGACESTMREAGYAPSASPAELLGGRAAAMALLKGGSVEMKAREFGRRIMRRLRRIRRLIGFD